MASSNEERVIEIVCENLGVNKEQVTRNTSLAFRAEWMLPFASTGYRNAATARAMKS